VKIGKVSILTLLFLVGSLLSAQQVSGSLDTLFQQLQSPDTSNKAAQVLVGRAEHDRQTRAYLRNKLPAMIDKGASGTPWTNAVRLAGQLKLGEAAPALAKWIGLQMGDTTMAQFMRLDDCPAGKALSQIGDPAIPALIHVINRGNTHERRNAYLVLFVIGSVQALATIRHFSPDEPDEGVRQFAEKLVAK
jgi:hypothetical protein